jgi:MoaA/NifB/PqqE/SkfB family radical SAM enzyme
MTAALNTSSLLRLGERVGSTATAVALRARPRLSVAMLMLTEECDSRCRSCSYRLPAPGELGALGMLRVVEDLAQLGTRTIALTGGEPLTVAGLPRLLARIRELGISLTLLTNGLQLSAKAGDLVGLVQDLIISLDGWDAASYKRLRGVDGLEAIREGIARVRALHAERQVAPPRIQARTTLQGGNAGELERLVDTARQLDYDGISLLAVDPGPLRFGRARERPTLLPEAAEITALRGAIERLAQRRPSPFSTGFIVESEAKVRAIADHLEASITDERYPLKRCNAPSVSIVIGSRGEVRPCFFKPPIGSLREQSLREVLTGSTLFHLRRTLDVATDEDCRPCVCPLSRPVREVLG